jgi:hypothetical protein
LKYHRIIEDLSGLAMVKIKHGHPIKRGIFLHCLLECWSKFNLS